MFGVYTYFTLMFLFAGIPLLILWFIYFKTLVKFKKIFLVVILGSFLFGGVWDNLAIKDEVWYFPNTVGIRFLGVPIEEWTLMFMLSLLTSSVTLLILKRGVK